MPFSIINTITSWFLKIRIHQIELFKKYPIEVQNEVLMSLIKNAENTELGKKYHFNNIKDYKTFSKKILNFMECINLNVTNAHTKLLGKANLN